MHLQHAVCCLGIPDLRLKESTRYHIYTTKCFCHRNPLQVKNNGMKKRERKGQGNGRQERQEENPHPHGATPHYVDTCLTEVLRARIVILLCNTGIPDPLIGLGLGVRFPLLLDSERAGDRHRLTGGELGLERDRDLDRERSPRNLSTRRSRSGDAPESESRLRRFARTGSMLLPMDALPVLVGEVPPKMDTGLGLGVGGVAGAGVSFAESEEVEVVVKSESLDSSTGIVPVPERRWLSSWSWSRLLSLSLSLSRSCPSSASAPDSETNTDIVIDIELSKCSRNRVSCEVFPPRCLHATDSSNGVDATRGFNSVGENGVSAPYLGSTRASLNGVSSLLVTSLDEGVSEPELVLTTRSERRIMTSGVWKDGMSMIVFPETSELGAVGGPVGQHARMGENAERRKEELIERGGAERLEVMEDTRRCPYP